MQCGRHSFTLPTTRLSKTERVVLGEVAKGKTTKQIADELYRSPQTISQHRWHISRKLGLDGSPDCLLKFALSSAGVIYLTELQLKERKGKNA